jgi:hypothetical protein
MNEVADNVEVAAQPATEAPVDGSPSGAVERPTWLPDKFETPEALATSYGELESKIGQSRDTIRDELMAEFEQEAYANRPETADHYTIPEGVDESLAVDNPLFRWWANHAFENGYSQEEFDDGIAQYAEFIASQGPDLDAERKNLGENASARIDAANAWANSFFPEELHGAFLMMGQTAVGIKALEYMQSQTKQSAMNGTAEAAPQITIEDVRTMQADPRYHDPVRRDRAFVAKVDEAYAKLFPS